MRNLLKIKLFISFFQMAPFIIIAYSQGYLRNSKKLSISSGNETVGGGKEEGECQRCRVLLRFLALFCSKILQISLRKPQQEPSILLSFSTLKRVLLLCVLLRRKSASSTKFLITLKVHSPSTYPFRSIIEKIYLFPSFMPIIDTNL